VQYAIDNVLKRFTTFVIAHRLSTIVNADKIIVLKDNRVVEIGRHNELLNQNGIYKQLYSLQFANQNK